MQNFMSNMSPKRFFVPFVGAGILFNRNLLWREAWLDLSGKLIYIPSLTFVGLSSCLLACAHVVTKHSTPESILLCMSIDVPLLQFTPLCDLYIITRSTMVKLSAMNVCSPMAAWVKTQISCNDPSFCDISIWWCIAISSFIIFNAICPHITVSEHCYIDIYASLWNMW